MITDDETPRHDIPPYVAYKTFLNTLEAFKATIPSQIDRSVVPNMSGGVYASLLCSLRVMKLVDRNNVPSVMFENLVNAKEGERRTLLRELFDQTYSFLFENGINLSQITLDQLNKVFSELGASGATVKKCRSFFLSFAKDAGVELSPYLKRASRSRSVRPRQKKQAQKVPKQSKEREDDITEESRTESDFLYEILDPEVMTEEEQKAVWTLMLYLKKQEALQE
jgi:hypothetical protein